MATGNWDTICDTDGSSSEIYHQAVVSSEEEVSVHASDADEDSVLCVSGRASRNRRERQRAGEDALEGGDALPPRAKRGAEASESEGETETGAEAAARLHARIQAALAEEEDEDGQEVSATPSGLGLSEGEGEGEAEGEDGVPLGGSPLTMDIKGDIGQMSGSHLFGGSSASLLRCPIVDRQGWPIKTEVKEEPRVPHSAAASTEPSISNSPSPSDPSVYPPSLPSQIALDGLQSGTYPVKTESLSLFMRVKSEPPHPSQTSVSVSQTQASQYVEEEGTEEESESESEYGRDRRRSRPSRSARRVAVQSRPKRSVGKSSKREARRERERESSSEREEWVDERSESEGEEGSEVVSEDSADVRPFPTARCCRDKCFKTFPESSQRTLMRSLARLDRQIQGKTRDEVFDLKKAFFFEHLYDLEVGAYRVRMCPRALQKLMRTDTQRFLDIAVAEMLSQEAGQADAQTKDSSSGSHWTASVPSTPSRLPSAPSSVPSTPPSRTFALSADTPQRYGGVDLKKYKGDTKAMLNALIRMNTRIETHKLSIMEAGAAKRVFIRDYLWDPEKEKFMLTHGQLTTLLSCGRTLLTKAQAMCRDPSLYLANGMTPRRAGVSTPPGTPKTTKTSRKKTTSTRVPKVKGEGHCGAVSRSSSTSSTSKRSKRRSDVSPVHAPLSRDTTHDTQTHSPLPAILLPTRSARGKRSRRDREQEEEQQWEAFEGNDLPPTPATEIISEVRLPSAVSPALPSARASGRLRRTDPLAEMEREREKAMRERVPFKCCRKRCFDKLPLGVVVGVRRAMAEYGRDLTTLLKEGLVAQWFVEPHTGKLVSYACPKCIIHLLDCPKHTLDRGVALHARLQRRAKTPKTGRGRERQDDADWEPEIVDFD
ncbi:hypothetical protein KIPB_000255 [Kipferlia bialata]|uniref:Uncharacterized protein n=1 Tax=Kipferlia bialata TaxID=797122 RepID=A0A9K3GDB5_9EUKA|nr:hypothetical protein KIPB_000255 [Kipferlia bialata]|eukprot:g255.t1